MEKFSPFTSTHFVSIFLSILLCVLAPIIFKQQLKRSDKILSFSIASSLIILEILIPFYDLYFLNYNWQSSFPLHMCDFSRMMAAIFLLEGPLVFIELAFFWGFAGGSIALLCPDISMSFPSIEFLCFFFTHGLLLFSLTYAVVVKGFKPTYTSALRSICYGALIASTIYLVNLWIGKPANYWYLIDTPEAAAFFKTILPEPPLHLLGYYLLGGVIMMSIYIPFHIHRNFNEKTNSI